MVIYNLQLNLTVLQHRPESQHLKDYLKAHVKKLLLLGAVPPRKLFQLVAQVLKVAMVPVNRILHRPMVATHLRILLQLMVVVMLLVVVGAPAILLCPSTMVVVTL